MKAQFRFLNLVLLFLVIIATLSCRSSRNCITAPATDTEPPDMKLRLSWAATDTGDSAKNANRTITLGDPGFRYEVPLNADIILTSSATDPGGAAMLSVEISRSQLIGGGDALGGPVYEERKERSSCFPRSLTDTVVFDGASRAKCVQPSFFTVKLSSTDQKGNRVQFPDVRIKQGDLIERSVDLGVPVGGGVGGVSGIPFPGYRCTLPGQSVRIEGRCGPVTIPVNQSGSRMVPLQSATRELTWYCGNTERKVRSRDTFDWVYIERTLSGSINWTLYKEDAF